jgi:hypothetical protein
MLQANRLPGETNFASFPLDTFAAPMISTGRRELGPQAAISSKSIYCRSSAGKSAKVGRLPRVASAMVDFMNGDDGLS